MSFVIDGPVVEALNSGRDRYRYEHLHATPWRLRFRDVWHPALGCENGLVSCTSSHTNIQAPESAGVSPNWELQWAIRGCHWTYFTFFIFSERREGLKVGFTRPEMPPSLD
jgi:hypothetical protein